MTIVMKNMSAVTSNIVAYQNILGRVLTATVCRWKSYRREQYKLRRIYLSSPTAQRFPWSVWKVHGAFLNEIDSKHL